MRSERIAELRALAAVAAPGPWEIHPSKGGDPVVVCVVEKFGLSVGATEPDSEWGVFHRQDAAFIVAARTALPEALDEVEVLTHIVAQATARIVAAEEAIKRVRTLAESIRGESLGEWDASAHFLAALEGTKP